MRQGTLTKWLSWLKTHRRRVNSIRSATADALTLITTCKKIGIPPRADLRSTISMILAGEEPQRTAARDLRPFARRERGCGGRVARIGASCFPPSG
jgi:hypothetical protein